MDHALASTNRPSWLHLSSSSSSRPRVALPRRLVGISSSSHRRRMLLVRAAQASGGDGADPSKGDTKVTNSSTRSLDISNLPSWAKWLLAPIILLALPFYRKFLKMEDELDRTAGSVVDVVQAVADGTEKMTSKLAEALPDGGKLEKLVLKVGDFAEEVGDRADLAEDIIDKVDDFVDKVDDMLEPIIEEELSGKSNPEEKVTGENSELKKETG